MKQQVSSPGREVRNFCAASHARPGLGAQRGLWGTIRACAAAAG